MSVFHTPERGDIVWISFQPQAGHEQAGRRPALTLSPGEYNRKVGLGLFCPITNQEKGYPFEVRIPEGLEVTGVVLSDQVKSLDWRARDARFLCRLDKTTMTAVLHRTTLLLAE